MSTKDIKREWECFMWSSKIPCKGDGWYKSVEYPSDLFTNCKLQFHLRTVGMKYTMYLEARIQKSNGESIKATISMHIVNQDIKKVTHSIKNWQDFCKLPALAITDELYNSENVHTFYFKVTRMKHMASLPKPKPLNLHNELGFFLSEATFNDVILVVENQEIPAHKVLLSACSPVFLAMLTVPMRESKENRIDITDVKFDTMKNVLAYIYTGNCDYLDDVDIALDVLAVAQKYEMINLKELCEYHLAESISQDNVLQILNEADNHSASNLQAECLNFMVQNPKFLKNNSNLKELSLQKPLLLYNFVQNIL